MLRIFFDADRDGEDEWRSIRDIMDRARRNASRYCIAVREVTAGLDAPPREDVHVEFAHDDVDDHTIVRVDNHRPAAFKARAESFKLERERVTEPKGQHGNHVQNDHASDGADTSR